MIHYTLQLLKSNLKYNQLRNELYITKQNYNTIIACFEFLTEMIQGPCHEN